MILTVGVAACVALLQSPASGTSLCQPAAQRFGLHEIDERLFPVDLDDRDQLPVARLQLRITVDRDLLELEPEFFLERKYGRACPLAEVAVSRVVQAD